MNLISIAEFDFYFFFKVQLFSSVFSCRQIRENVCNSYSAFMVINIKRKLADLMLYFK